MWNTGLRLPQGKVLRMPVLQPRPTQIGYPGGLQCSSLFARVPAGATSGPLVVKLADGRTSPGVHFTITSSDFFAVMGVGFPTF